MEWNDYYASVTLCIISTDIGVASSSCFRLNADRQTDSVREHVFYVLQVSKNVFLTFSSTDMSKAQNVVRNTLSPNPSKLVYNIALVLHLIFYNLGRVSYYLFRC